MVYFITGKQGAGKTHYASNLAKELKEKGFPVANIDGDEWRLLHSNKDFTDSGRLKNLKSAAKQAQKLEKDGFIVILSFIAPKREWRYLMREYWKTSRVIYIPGGSLWKGTIYQEPDNCELDLKINIHG